MFDSLLKFVANVSLLNSSSQQPTYGPVAIWKFVNLIGSTNPNADT